MISIAKKSSVHIAKQRLQGVLSSDRLTCKPELVPELQSDLYSTLSKYIDIDRHNFKVELKHSEINIKF